ncbi:MAG: hypothetical protein ABEJ56_02455 [Candidatus Nanohaloarchaea archaeon]
MERSKGICWNRNYRRRFVQTSEGVLLQQESDGYEKVHYIPEGDRNSNIESEGLETVDNILDPGTDIDRVIRMAKNQKAAENLGNWIDGTRGYPQDVYSQSSTVASD